MYCNYTISIVVFFYFLYLELYSNDDMFLGVFSGPLNSISRGHEMIFYVFSCVVMLKVRDKAISKTSTLTASIVQS